MTAPDARTGSPPPVLKLSAPDRGGYWEVPVLYEDQHVLAVDKPSGLLTSPDRYDPERPNLMRLLHSHISRGVPWARDRQLGYLMNAHRLDLETSGVLLLAKSKPVLTALASCFGSEKPTKTYLALTREGPEEDFFTVDLKIAPHPFRPGVMHTNLKLGKRSRTEFKVLTRYLGFTWMECRPLTGRTHQIRVHLKAVRCPIVGDRVYEGSPLWLSELKRDYRPPRNREERPLMGRVALHASRLSLPHPVTGDPLEVESPLPKDLRVALKYLDRYALPGALTSPFPPESPSGE